jgi:hypothetical protein
MWRFFAGKSPAMPLANLAAYVRPWLQNGTSWQQNTSARPAAYYAAAGKPLTYTNQHF